MFATHKLMSVLLISLALCGVQVAQASPLHDHVSHMPGCSLCHFDGAQALRAPDDCAQPAPVVRAVSLPGIKACNTDPVFPAYLTRAPPHLSA